MLLQAGTRQARCDRKYVCSGRAYDFFCDVVGLSFSSTIRLTSRRAHKTRENGSRNKDGSVKIGGSQWQSVAVAVEVVDRWMNG